jgi:hypothetical protein
MGKQWLSVHVMALARGRVAVPLHGRVRSTMSLFRRRRALTTDDGRLDCSGVHAGIAILVLVLAVVWSQWLASSTVLPASASAVLLSSLSHTPDMHMPMLNIHIRIHIHSTGAPSARHRSLCPRPPVSRT